MAPRESQKRASLKWDKENMTTLGCKVKREQAADFKAYCDGQGKTSNTVLKDFVLECIDKPPATRTGAFVATVDIQASEVLLNAAQTVSAPAIAIPPEKLNQAKAHAEARREPVSGFLIRAIDETMERDRNAPAASQGNSEGEST
ncbi:MAG: hypothetical protein HFH26_03995 [Clostridiaceae bacterium]|nr:hypothetical protein [Clostridiaceae bacterium]